VVANLNLVRIYIENILKFIYIVLNIDQPTHVAFVPENYFNFNCFQFNYTLIYKLKKSEYLFYVLSQFTQVDIP